MSYKTSFIFILEKVMSLESGFQIKTFYFVITPQNHMLLSRMHSFFSKTILQQQQQNSHFPEGLCLNVLSLNFLNWISFWWRPDVVPAAGLTDMQCTKTLAVSLVDNSSSSKASSPTTAKNVQSCLPSQTQICRGLCFLFTSLMRW